MLILCFIIGVVLGLPYWSNAQISADSIPHGGLYRWSGPRFYRQEHSIGLLPAIQMGQALYLGLGIARARFSSGEGGGRGSGLTLGLDVNPYDGILAPKLSLWTTGHIFFFGGYLGLNGQYYFQNNQSTFVFRPEIGIGYLKVFLSYGYNFWGDNNIDNLGRHSIALGYYHTIIPR